MNRSAILANRADLIEGTFCYKLFELHIFDEKLFIELTDGIFEYLSDEKDRGGRLDREMLNFLSWFVMGVMHCVICHNDVNDRYKIEKLDMNLWYEKYEEKLSSLLNRSLNLI